MLIKGVIILTLVMLENNTPITTSKIIADGVGNVHKNVVSLIRNYEEEIKNLRGILPFQTSTTENGKKGRPYKLYYLDKKQTTFLIMLMANNENTIKLKQMIVENKLNFNDFMPKPDLRKVYIIKNLNSLYKIGISKNIAKRIRTIETQQCSKVKTIYTSKFCINAIQIESKIHKLYENHRKLGEWFDLDNNNINDIIKFIESSIETEKSKTIQNTAI
jgi:phage regulator Rha-like protein